MNRGLFTGRRTAQFDFHRLFPNVPSNIMIYQGTVFGKIRDKIQSLRIPSGGQTRTDVNTAKRVNEKILGARQQDNARSMLPKLIREGLKSNIHVKDSPQVVGGYAYQEYDHIKTTRASPRARRSDLTTFARYVKKIAISTIWFSTAYGLDDRPPKNH